MLANTSGSNANLGSGMGGIGGSGSEFQLPAVNQNKAFGAMMSRGRQSRGPGVSSLHR